MRPLSSPYMAWAKHQQMVQPARYELSSSGLSAATSADWPEPIGYEPGPSPRDVPPPLYGHPALIEGLSRRYKVAPEQILPVPGGASLANFVAVSCLHQGRSVAMESPGYEPLRRMIESMTTVTPLYRTGARGFALDLAQVESALSSGAGLVVLTDLHNPTGATLDVGTLQRLNQAAEHHDAWILVDEIYLDAVPGRRPPAAALGPRLATTGSLTKIYGLGALRCGWLMAAPQVVVQARGWADTVYGAGSISTERVAAQAVARLDHFRARYERLVGAHRPIMEAWLDQHPDIPCVRPSAGLMYFVELPDGVHSEAFDRRLRQSFDTGVSPGHFFGEPGGVRIGIGMADPDVLKNGLLRVAEAWYEARQTSPLEFPRDGRASHKSHVESQGGRR